MAVDNNIATASYDKTYIGRVVQKQVSENRTSSDPKMSRFVSGWDVVAGGQNFKIDVNNSDITSVGQQVRVFVPNNNKQKAYAEVINPALAPDKCIYIKDDSDYEDYKTYGIDNERQIGVQDVTVNTLTQYWFLADGTYLQKIYILTLINVGTENEEITNVIYPDGRVEKLSGFIIGTGQRSNETKKMSHPIQLEYKDNDDEYNPESIEADEGETFDTVTETWKYNVESETPFDRNIQYEIGDIVAYSKKVYECITSHKGEWNPDHFNEVEQKTVIWGVGVINKGEDNEIINRLIYPDETYISLINFNGEGGLG